MGLHFFSTEGKLLVHSTLYLRVLYMGLWPGGLHTLVSCFLVFLRTWHSLSPAMADAVKEDTSRLVPSSSLRQRIPHFITSWHLTDTEFLTEPNISAQVPHTLCWSTWRIKRWTPYYKEGQNFHHSCWQDEVLQETIFWPSFLTVLKMSINSEIPLIEKFTSRGSCKNCHDCKKSSASYSNAK